MNKSSIVLSFVILISLFTSCSKDNKSILTASTWTPVSITVLGTNFLPECNKDDEINFTTSNKAITKDLGVLCSGSVIGTSDTADYGLSEDGKNITLSVLTYNFTLKIDELTSTSFKCSGNYTEPNSQLSIPVAVEMKGK